jgi:hypothetical protein
MKPIFKFTSPILLLAGSLVPLAAQAYVGPGAGITLIGALIGLVSAIFLALWAVLRWPFRKFMARRKAERAASDAAGKSSESGKQ